MTAFHHLIGAGGAKPAPEWEYAATSGNDGDLIFFAGLYVSEGGLPFTPSGWTRRTFGGSNYVGDPNETIYYYGYGFYTAVSSSTTRNSYNSASGWNLGKDIFALSRNDGGTQNLSTTGTGTFNGTTYTAPVAFMQFAARDYNQSVSAGLVDSIGADNTITRTTTGGNNGMSFKLSVWLGDYSTDTSVTLSNGGGNNANYWMRVNG